MLRIISKILKVLAWGVAIVSTLVQLLVLLAYAMYWDQAGKPFIFVVTLAATLTLWAGFVLQGVCKKKPLLGLSVITLSAVLFIAAAVIVQQSTMPGNISHINQTTGDIAMDWGKLLWRHYLPVLTPALLWLSEWAKRTYVSKKEMQDILKAIRTKKTEDVETLDLQTDPTGKK